MYSISPAFYVLRILYLAPILCGVWVVIDSLRPKRRRTLARIEEQSGAKREPLIFYQIYCATMVILFMVQQVFALTLARDTPVRTYFAAVAMMGTFLGTFVIVLYLLRVVFPKGTDTSDTTRNLPTGEEPPL